MAKVLIASDYFGSQGEEGYGVLRQAGLELIPTPPGWECRLPGAMLPYIGEADAVIAGIQPIGRELMDAAPRLQVISRRGVGLDSVDCAYAATRGIQVTCTPGLVEIPVAELVLGYILHWCRRIPSMDAQMHQGVWQHIPCSLVAGKTLGLVGMGHIASQVARRARAFDMNILYSSRQPHPEAEQSFSAQRRSMEQLLAEADFVSLHTPLTPETRDLIDEKALALMKPSAYLINTARGPVVNEQALADALREQRLAGAAVDVFDREPPTGSPLLGLNNALLTPHAGPNTVETVAAIDRAAAQNVVDVLRERRERR